ncbi:hypothetical protein Hanom_Chr07g00610451 [Helianthus anomalus]
MFARGCFHNSNKSHGSDHTVDPRLAPLFHIRFVFQNIVIYEWKSVNPLFAFYVKENAL